MELDEAREGSRLALSRALTLVENGLSFSTEEDGMVIGVTGAPGVGKSCLVDRIATSLAKNGIKVAILAVDPSSPVSGGALLGDRIRMQSADVDDLIYMRSLATRGESGAVPSVIGNMTNLLKECGWKHILVETVGSGQAEFRIAAVADTILLVEAPGRGDSIQAEKAGIIELVDFIAVNKSDLPQAEAAASDIEQALSAGSKDIPVMLVSAQTGDGVPELVQKILETEGQSMTRPKWREKLNSEWMRQLNSHPDLESILDGLEEGSFNLDEAINNLRR
jgi:LAO/AO transport system kinase